MQSAVIGRVRYPFCLTIRVCEEGVGLSVWPILRIGNPDLLIPWHHLRYAQARGRLLWRFVDLSIGDPPITGLLLSKDLFERLARLCAELPAASGAFESSQAAASLGLATTSELHWQRKPLFTLRWAAERIFVPLAFILFLLLFRWGQQNMGFAFLVPFPVTMLYLHRSSRNWPKTPDACRPAGFRTTVWLGRTIEGIALLVLFGLLFVTPVWTGMARLGWVAVFGWLVGLYFFPYVALTLFARFLLGRAYTSVDQCMSDTIGSSDSASLPLAGPKP
jgi:hypothetical protein